MTVSGQTFPDSRLSKSERSGCADRRAGTVAHSSEDRSVSPFAGLTEIRGAFRGLQRSPTIALSAVVCIALGLGSAAAISSAVDRALVQRLPFRAPERIVTVYRTTPHFDNGPFSPLNYLDLARMSTSVPQLAAIGFGTGLLALPNQAMQVDLKRASGNLFPMLGVQALRGRLILPEDDGLDREPVAVLSEEFWRERFGGDPAIVGRTIRLDGMTHTVVGIVPRRFGVPHGNQVARAQVWVPMRFTKEEQAMRNSNFL